MTKTIDPRGTPPPASPPKADRPVRPAPRRRRLRRWLILAVALALLLVAGDAGAGWYFSDEVLNLDRTTYPVQVKAVAGDTVTLTRDANTARPVRYGLTWPGGHAVLDDTVRVSAGSVVRTVVQVTSGSLTPGLHAYMDTSVFAGDPKTGRGLDFSPATVSGQLGDLPAWFVPSTASNTRTTWAIAVHGRGGTREETLRIMPTLAGLGLPTLAIAYRNDAGAPASPDRHYHLGDTEWRDVTAAIAYAQAHGASGVVLYGWSMGGAMVMTALRRMPAAQAALVRAVVLDSPVLDWGATLAMQAEQRNLPGFLTWTAERLAEWRAGLSLADFDQLPYAPLLRVPTLVFVDLADSTVPTGPSLRFADARPDVVTLVSTAGGDHTGSWNVAPSQYESAVRQFLGRYT